MTYYAMYPTVVHSFILSLMLVQGTYQLLHANYGRGLLQLLIACIIIFSYFIRYQVKLKKSSILYNIMFLGSVISSKEIACTDTRKIVFKRIGWSSKGAFIFTNKLLPIRLVNFKPESMYEELQLYGKRNLITMVMSDEFNHHQQEMTKES